MTKRIRPHHFGESLLLSMLAHYYDMDMADYLEIDPTS